MTGTRRKRWRQKGRSMKRISVDLPQSGYDIYIERGLLDKAGEYIRSSGDFSRLVIVTEPHVWDLYGERLVNSLKANGIDPTIITMPRGEQAKEFSQLEKVYDEFTKAGLLRSDLVLAFGGGAIGDLTGYAAATYMRGIKYIQIPTTLLAQVDSSVGGKTAINLKQGKNLVGAFWQPKMVLSDPELLASLSDRDFAGGMAEVIKYAAIASKELFKILSNLKGRKDAMEYIEDIVAHCCKIKAEIVVEDELDQGLRMILNFGHTFGHAIEKIGHFNTYSHGEAVSIGMVLAIKAGIALGITPEDCLGKFSSLLSAFGLPVSLEIKTSDLFPEMLLDKKNANDQLRLILMKEIGDSLIHEIKAEKLHRLIEGEL